MIPQDEVAVDTVGSFFGIDIGRILDGAVQTATVDGATAGDLHVEPEVLAQFYNQLSDLHSKIRAEMIKLHETAVQAHEQNAGGLLPGAQAAWKAMTVAAGAETHSNSLYGNMLSVDHLVLNHMFAIQQTLETYVEHEGLAVVGFGKVGMDTPGSSAQGPVKNTEHTVRAI